MKYSSLWLITLLLPLACGDTIVNEVVQEKPEPEAEALTITPMGTSFATLEQDEVLYLGIHKDALTRDFLLQTALIDQAYLPDSTGLKSRIVRWVFASGALQLLDVTTPGPEGYRPRQMLLNSFPVYRRAQNYTFIQFSDGVSSLFTGAEWWASDYGGAEYDPDNERQAVAILDGFVNSIDNVSAGVPAQEVLVIHQVLQLQKPDIVDTAQMAFWLTPYAPDASYAPFEAPAEFNQVGFFTIAPIFAPSEAKDKVFATRFHPGKTITYAISHNTPAAYRQAVRDGILYWNKAFDSEVVKVIDAPEGVHAPDVRYNMIQWVPDDRAAYAYADAQADPRTGETLHANVYLTSTFVVSGSKWSRSQENAFTPQPTRPRSNAALCRYGHDSEAQSRARHSMAINALEPAVVLKASKDYLTEVVAHEVGHTLGLRHNFAGSLGTSYNSTKRQEYLAQYLRGDDLAESVVSTTSAMEYSPTFEAVVSGSRMRRGLPAGSYDRMAIQYLYRGAEIPNGAPLFCTDSEVDATGGASLVGCTRFDVGSSSLSSSETYEKEVFAALPGLLMSSFIREKLATGGIAHYTPSAAAWAAYLYGKRLPMFLAFDERATTLEVARSATLATSDYLTDTVATLGGLNTILAPPDPQVGPTLVAGFARLVQKEEVINYQGPAGQSYTFAAAEVVTMKETVSDFADRLYSALLVEELRTLGTDEIYVSDAEYPIQNLSLRDDSAGDLVLAHLAARQAELLAVTATRGPAEEVIRLGSAAQLVMPTFRYSARVRRAAAGLLNYGRGSWIGFGYDEREELSVALGTIMVTDALGLDVVALRDLSPLEQTSSTVARAILTHRTILNRLESNPWIP